MIKFLNQVLEMRTCVLNEFVRKRVKSLVPGDVERIINNYVRLEINNQIGTISTSYTIGSKIIIKQEILTKINEIVNDKASESRLEVERQIREAVATVINKVNIAALVETYSKHYAEEEIKKQVRERLSKISSTL